LNGFPGISPAGEMDFVIRRKSIGGGHYPPPVFFLRFINNKNSPVKYIRMADNFQQLQYNAWESQHLTKHSDLMKKYNEIKQKESLLGEQTSGKTTKRDLLLTQKKNMTISKLGSLELDKIERDAVVDTKYDTNIDVILVRKENEILEAHAMHERRLKKIEADFQHSLKYYDSEKKASLDKNTRMFESKKRILEERGENIDAEKAITTRTAAELTIEANKIKILTEIKRSIDIIEMSRGSVPNGRFLQPLPTMPEPLSESAVTPVERQQSTATTEEILESLGEDASLAIMRAEAQAEDRRIRREAFEEEMQRNEIMLAHRRQLEREADERRAEREARERQERQQQPVTPPFTQDEEDWDMSQEEIDAHIAKRKAEMKTPRREN